MELDWNPSERRDSHEGNSALVEHRPGGLGILKLVRFDSVLDNLMAS